MLQDAPDLTGCDRAVQQLREAAKPWLPKRNRDREGVQRDLITHPQFCLSHVESTKSSPTVGTSHVKGDRPLHTRAAISSLQGYSAKSKISTGQGSLALMPPTRQHVQAPRSPAAVFLG